MVIINQKVLRHERSALEADHQTHMVRCMHCEVRRAHAKESNKTQTKTSARRRPRLADVAGEILGKQN
jgi:hypothetical protein